MCQTCCGDFEQSWPQLLRVFSVSFGAQAHQDLQCFPPFLPYKDMLHMNLDSEKQPFVHLLLSGAHGLHCLTGGPCSDSTFNISYISDTMTNDHVHTSPRATTGVAATLAVGLARDILVFPALAMSHTSFLCLLRAQVRTGFPRQSRYC